MKTIYNNTLNIKNVGETVTLYGWANKVRKLGGLIFIDLRDRSGIIQIRINEENSYYQEALKIKNEYVLKVSGKVLERENKNKNIETGEIEIELNNLEILNTSEVLPFELENTTATEETRLKYRYIDIRRENIKNNLLTRHKITKSIREFLDNNGFIEVETPILNKSTPEGARDYLVPSRIYKGNFYALPQSPQIFKQLLMVSGIERYYQLSRCFRDEDLRSDRQPEFTQIDIEMSFATEEDIYKITEEMISKVMKDVKDYNITLPLPRMTYDEAINKYGSDKPDTRYDMTLKDITNIFKDNDFVLFKDKIINAIVVKNAADKYSRKKIDELTTFVKNFKINNLFFLKYNNELTGSIIKNINTLEKEQLIKELKLENNDLVFIVSDTYKKVKESLGALRVKLASELDLRDKNKFNFLWVTDFPMFEYSEEENRYISAHHPFTMPKDVNTLNDKENCYARAYDIVINGYELASGSVRIHDKNIQDKVFEALEIDETTRQEKFGFLLEAFKYGAPPHAGIAPGLERLTMVLCGTDNIKDVVAFPKTQNATCLMSNSPSKVDKKALDILGIEVKENE